MNSVPLPILTVALVVAILVIGAIAYFIIERRSKTSTSSLSAPPGLAQQGYGQERWVREVALWTGILRRLEIQAKYQDPVPEHLQRELATARAKLAEAEKLSNKKA